MESLLQLCKQVMQIAKGGQKMSSTNSESMRLAYIRTLFDHVIEWYKNADTKAQVLLTLDGAFLAFLINPIFQNPDTLASVVAKFGTTTWVFLALTCVSLTVSIASALTCLWSRLYSGDELERVW